MLEIYEFEKPAFYGFNGKGGRKGKKAVVDDSDRSEEYRKQSAYRARENIRRLCLANFDNHSKFITLTFRDGSVKDVTNVKECNVAFKKFIQRMRRRYGKFKYIAVIEFQDENGRGAVHYHMISDLSYIPIDQLTDVWKNGHVWINDIRQVDNVGAYMIKYMLKDMSDTRLQGLKSYLCSKGLSKPEVYRGSQAELIYNSLNLDEKKEVYTSSYKSEHHGLITYKEYNFNR